MKKFTLSLLFAIIFIFAQAQKGYDIQVEVSGFEGDTLYLANFLMDKQFFADTAIAEKGVYRFTGSEPLPGGVYLVILPPDNRYFQFLVNENDQHFSIATNNENPAKDVRIKGSKDNNLFYEYMQFLSEQTAKATPLREQLKEARAAKDEKKVDELMQQMKGLDTKVKTYQHKIVEDNPSSVTAQLIKLSFQPEIPEFEGPKAEVDRKRFYYFREHYFDNIELSNPVLLRTPFLYKKLDEFEEKYTAKHPDSLIKSLDIMLESMEAAPETFMHYLVHWLNKYAASKYVGMDAVYVHLVDNYYATGKATWSDEEQLKKIVDNADALRPILLGKIAPELNLFELDIPGTIAEKENEDELKRVKTGSVRPLHEVSAKYTILVFWEPTCGHCKKEMPRLGELYKKVRHKGVEVYAVCGKTVQEDGMVLCAEFLKDKELMEWINVVDPYYRTKFKTTYNIKSTPQIFVLDENKEIINKKIGVEQLEEMLERVLEEE